MQASINSRGVYFPTDDTFLMARHITSYLFSFPCTVRCGLERFALRHGTACLVLPVSALRTQLRRGGHDSAPPVICIVRQDSSVVVESLKHGDLDEVGKDGPPMIVLRLYETYRGLWEVRLCHLTTVRLLSAE